MPPVEFEPGITMFVWQNTAQPTVNCRVYRLRLTFTVHAAIRHKYRFICKGKPRVSVNRYTCFGGTSCFHYQGTVWSKLQ